MIIKAHNTFLFLTSFLCPADFIQKKKNWLLKERNTKHIYLKHVFSVRVFKQIKLILTKEQKTFVIITCFSYTGFNQKNLSLTKEQKTFLSITCFLCSENFNQYKRKKEKKK